MNPPDKPEASELFRRLTSEAFPDEVVDYPRLDADGQPLGQLRIRLLPLGEHDTARLRAQRWLRETRRMPVEDWNSPLVKEVMGDAVARHLLCAACLQVKPYAEDERGRPIYGRVFQTPEDMQAIPPSELAMLFHSYLMVQHQFGGVEARIETQEEVDDWTEKLVQGGSAAPLGRLSLEALGELSLRLAQTLAEAREAMASAGLQFPSSDSGDGGESNHDTSGSSTSSLGVPPPDSATEPPLPPAVEDEDLSAMTMDAAIDITKKLGKR